jgi:hypothetical protein
MSEQAKEDLGVAIDRLDALSFSLRMPLPAQLHVDQMKLILPSLVKDMKMLYAQALGVDPWKDGP